jgi:hypothetical protein
MQRALLSFLAAFLATLVIHQPVLWLLHQMHVTSALPYATQPVPPFGVPKVISLAFWGGVWGIVMIAAIARARGAGYWLAAAVFGAVLPTLVGRFVIGPLRGQSAGHAGPAMMTALLVGFTVNAAWGVGTALFYRMFAGGRR